MSLAEFDANATIKKASNFFPYLVMDISGDELCRGEMPFEDLELIEVLIFQGL